MKLLKKRAGKYLEMPFFEYHFGRFTCNSIARLLQKAYKRGDKHEFNHLAVAFSAITTHECTEICPFDDEWRGYVDIGELVQIKVLV